MLHNDIGPQPAGIRDSGNTPLYFWRIEEHFRHHVGPEYSIRTYEVGGKEDRGRHIEALENREGMEQEIKPAIVKSNGTSRLVVVAAGLSKAADNACQRENLETFREVSEMLAE
jgi:hypothetical protein